MMIGTHPRARMPGATKPRRLFDSRFAAGSAAPQQSTAHTHTHTYHLPDTTMNNQCHGRAQYMTVMNVLAFTGGTAGIPTDGHHKAGLGTCRHAIPATDTARQGHTQDTVLVVHPELLTTYSDLRNLASFVIVPSSSRMRAYTPEQTRCLYGHPLYKIVYTSHPQSHAPGQLHRLEMEICN
jgi:hypothetical protein